MSTPIFVGNSVAVLLGLGHRNEFERKELELGVSDGIDVEIVSGLDEGDKVKVWNKLEKKDDDDS